MASSSVSQESLDREDIDITTRRCKTRTMRARGAVHRGTEREGSDATDRDGRDQNGEYADEGDGLGAAPDHESPTRTAATRTKDKRTRPNHLHKGKPPKDKRKLREKRRSTGVVHLPSTVSTGDSLDDDDDADKVAVETKRNTTYNEVIHPDSRSAPTPDEHSHKGFVTRRTKSPSDLDADLEDNQDYDSAVSQSETNLTLIGQLEQAGTKTNFTKALRASRSQYSPPESTTSFISSFRTGSDQESKTPTSSTSSSSSSSVLSRYREMESVKHEPASSLLVHLTRDSKSEQETVRPISNYIARIQDRQQKAETASTNYLPRFRERDGPARFPRDTFQGIHHHSSREEVAHSVHVEKLLEKERDENRRLQRIIEDRERRISELENEVALLNTEMDECEDENRTLRTENQALINAFSQLSTTV